MQMAWSRSLPAQKQTFPNRNILAPALAIPTSMDSQAAVPAGSLASCLAWSGQRLGPVMQDRLAVWQAWPDVQENYKHIN